MLRVVRLNEGVIRVWCEILRQVPNARLRLYQEPFKYSDMRHYFADRFAKYGVAPARIIFDYISPHWKGYNEIDIALDAFPNNGGVTTLESLWMGVPVLTRQGRPGVGRYGATILCPLGLTDWITDCEKGYIDKAVKAASDLAGLAELRAGLRQRFENSPLQDAPKFTRSLEAAYVQMIDRYRSASSAAHPVSINSRTNLLPK